MHTRSPLEREVRSKIGIEELKAITTEEICKTLVDEGLITEDSCTRLIEKATADRNKNIIDLSYQLELIQL